LGSLGTAATNRPIVPAPGDYDDGEIGGMIGRGNRSTWRKPAPVPFCAPHSLPVGNPDSRGGKPATNGQNMPLQNNSELYERHLSDMDSTKSSVGAYVTEARLYVTQV
jgi:hypothetical protein